MNNPTHSHTHCQAAQGKHTSPSLSISVSFPTHGQKNEKKKIKTGYNNRYKTYPSGYVS
tara:strand:- start:798 stop:974 length:177 start_codon:yes stop_codon:yes gene_type:complete